MVKKFILPVAILSVFAVLLAVPMVASAAVTQPSTSPGNLPTAFSSCDAAGAKAACTVTNILQILLAIVFLVAVIYLVVGGFRYIISQGNEEGVEKAKGTITNAIIGLVVVLLAWIILRVVYNLLESGTTAA